MVGLVAGSQFVAALMSRAAAVAPVRRVTSSPSMVTVQPALQTAVGRGLRVGPDVVLGGGRDVAPGPADPPMITNSRTQSASRGSRRTASAMLVSGPCRDQRDLAGSGAPRCR